MLLLLYFGLFFFENLVETVAINQVVQVGRIFVLAGRPIMQFWQDSA